jgi:RNA polymerase sigma-70 factor (ECF subfamily)
MAFLRRVSDGDGRAQRLDPPPVDHREGSEAAGHSSSNGGRSVIAEAATTNPDLAVLMRCRAGDRLAWKTLHDAHFDFVYRVARRLGVPDHEAEDICQEVFLVAFRRLDSFGDGRFASWLYRITANVVSQRHRRARVRRFLNALVGGEHEPAAPTATPERAVEAHEIDEGVRQILERLAPKKREVFALFELEGLSGEEIASQVGCRLETVWTRLHYARREFARLARKQGLMP